MSGASIWVVERRTRESMTVPWSDSFTVRITREPPRDWGEPYESHVVVGPRVIEWSQERIVEYVPRAALELRSERRERERAGEVSRLAQVAIEAIRVIHCTTHGGDPRVFEPCETCSLGGVGNLRDALTKALGPNYTALVWGLDMNIDMDELEKRLTWALQSPAPKCAPCEGTGRVRGWGPATPAYNIECERCHGSGLSPAPGGKVT